MTTNSIQHESETAFDETLSFKEATRIRRSIRGFLDKPVPESVIRAVLEDAQHAPSNCNTQPCNTHIVRGEKLKQLSPKHAGSRRINTISQRLGYLVR